MPNHDVFISTEIRLDWNEDGSTSSPHPAAVHARWKPYVAALGSVKVVGRRRPAAGASTAGLVSGDGVDVVGLPYYHGLPALIRAMPQVMLHVFRLGGRGDIFIGRLPEPLSLLLFLRALAVKGRFVSLVVADPRQLAVSLAPGLVGRVGGKVLARVTQACVARSTAVVYVTQSWLQGLYPARSGTPVLARSNVALDDSSFVEEARRGRLDAGRINLVTVATLESPAKGVDVLLEVVAELARRGVGATLDVIGGGRELEHLQGQAAHLHLGPQEVRFHGQLSSVTAVRTLLDSADIYVSASRFEGLPRAVIEAQARALPVVSTNAGGMIELVPGKHLVEIDDANALASRIEYLAASPAAYGEASRSNLDNARTIKESSSEAHLIEFLRHHLTT